jgi:hypothetical protein
MPIPAELCLLWDRWRAARRGQGPAVLATAVNAVAVAVSVVWFAGLLLAHLKVIAQPGPQEYNEPAIWHVTYLLDQGRNPYSAAELPGSAMFFTPLYNFVVLAFKPLLGIDYPAHRMVSLLFLVAALAVLVRAVVRAGAGLGIALLMAVFLYWMSLNNIQTSARPDTMGLFFFLLALLVPWENGYSRRATLVGLVCAGVAFYAKFYFVLSGCLTLLAVFLLQSKGAAVRLGLGFFTALAVSFFGCCLVFPYFYIETVIVQQGGAKLNSSDQISAMHTEMFLTRCWPFMLMLAVGLGLWLSRRWWRRRSEAVARLDAEERRLAVLGAGLAIFGVIVYFYMGRNAGAYFTYHLHLLVPLLMLLSAYAVRARWLRICAGVLLSGFVALKMEVPVVPDSVAPYRRMEQLVFACQGEVLGIASLTDVFERANRPVLHNGNTMFLGFAFEDGRAERDPMVGLLAKRMEANEGEVTRKVTAREYALVFTEFDDPYFCKAEVLKQHYDMTEQIDFYTFFGHSPVRVWKPKPR